MKSLAPASAALQPFSPEAEGAAPSRASDRVRRWLALGDSYTIGESVSEAKRWPVQVRGLLQAYGYKIELTIIARTGWTCDELWSGIRAAQLNPPYDLVSLLIGVNNQYRGLGLDEYHRQFLFLLEKAISYTGDVPRKVLVLSIPDWGVTPFADGMDREGIAAEIDMFNAINREVATGSGVHYVDVTSESRRDGKRADYVASDGLHPSGKMYAEWARLALPSAFMALQVS